MTSVTRIMILPLHGRTKRKAAAELELPSRIHPFGGWLVGMLRTIVTFLRCLSFLRRGISLLMATDVHLSR